MEHNRKKSLNEAEEKKTDRYGLRTKASKKQSSQDAGVKICTFCRSFNSTAQ
ncbi:hypothetical protein HanXRQr2_Chr10g0427791 [Helianthus annuus]|uniref:Uncharacterized protein n=1 Tax=Helianthus annuus TaxID=4232 RepID=A0A251TH62_HELAN|nr:hypothetical protein HanXRQr2_Chr10g0427791 [Helianthus annuus]